jgi:uncharacterized protein
MINRKIDFRHIQTRIRQFRVTAILGPRQCGKTTLARRFHADEYFDLENPRDLARLDHPQLVLENCTGLIVIDEIQRKQDLFPLLRFLVDTHPKQKYLILGSASRDLIQQSSESLAGRISFYTLYGFRKDDIAQRHISQLWLRGGFPPAFLAKSNESSIQWRVDYIGTFLERDIPNLGIRIAPETLRRFWLMLSFYHGQIINFSELGRSFGLADTTIRHYLDILQGTFMIRLLQPWFINIGKRLVKRPKLYIRDSGILHCLLDISNEKSLSSHAKLGSSWEGFAMENVCRCINKADEQFYFWATHSGAEVDLFWQHEGHNWACEFKYADAPKMTKSIQSALDSLQLKKLWIIYPGKTAYALDKKVMVLPFQDIKSEWDYS